MIESVVKNEIYLSPTGKRFQVNCIGRHAQDCSVTMIVYVNLDPTDDSPIGTIWTIEETLFLKLFSHL